MVTIEANDGETAYLVALVDMARGRAQNSVLSSNTDHERLKNKVSVEVLPTYIGRLARVHPSLTTLVSLD